MDVRESRIVDGREWLLQIDGQTEMPGVTMQLSLADESKRRRKVRLLGGVVLGGEPCSFPSPLGDGPVPKKTKQ